MPSSTSEVLTRPAPVAPALWEKADTVLWAFTPDGIVLHNFARGLYLDLDAGAHVVWSYLDGVHTTAAIADKLCETAAFAGMSKPGRIRQVKRVMADLAAGGFIRSVA